MCATISSLTLALAAPALAQDAGGTQLQEVIVTAQKREQRLQDVPVAVTALAAESLVANRITSVRDLDSVSPNLTVRTVVGGSLLPNYTIRGLVSQGSAVGSDKGVAVYFDGVYLGSGTGSIFELADVERIEVLRGPQGTLFGRNSTGGAIAITTPQPRGEFHVKQTVTLGNLDQVRTLTRVDTPQIGPFSALFTYTHSEREGDVKNLGAGTVWNFCCRGGKTISQASSSTLGGNNLDAVAATVMFTPNDDFTATYRFDRTDTTYTQDAIGTLWAGALVRGIIAAQPNPSILTPIASKRPDAVNNGDSVPNHNTAWGHALTTTWRLNDHITLKNIAAVRHLRYDAYWADISGQGGLINTGGPAFAVLGPLAALTVGAPFQVQATATHGDDNQWSDEFQANWTSDFVTLTTGALYYKQSSSKGAGIPLDNGEPKSGAFRVYPGYNVPYPLVAASGGGRSTKITTHSKAVFAQGEFHLTSQIDAIGGVRYTDDKKDGLDVSLVSGAAPTLTFPVRYQAHNTSFNLGVNYKPTRDILVYGKYATGYISGGGLAGLIYQPEKAKSAEAGIKADWFGRTLRTNLAVFDVKYSDLQIAISGNNLSPPQPTITQALINAGDAKAKGFELETTWLPVRGLTLTSGIGYTDFKFTRIDPVYQNGNLVIYPGNRPKWTTNLAATYETEPFANDVTLLARIDGNWKSKQYGIGSLPISIAAAEREAYVTAGTIGAYWLVNGRIALQGLKLGTADASLALWGRNLFNDRSPSYTPSLVTEIAVGYERARTFGVDFNVEF